MARMMEFHGLTAAQLAPNVSSATARLDAFSLRSSGLAGRKGHYPCPLAKKHQVGRSGLSPYPSTRWGLVIGQGLSPDDRKALPRPIRPKAEDDGHHL